VRFRLPTRWAIAVRALAGLWLLLSALPDAEAQTGALEYAVKATYLYKFIPFVEWPSGAFATPSSPVVLCVAFYDPFDGILDRAVAGQRVGERAVVVRRLATVDRGSGCHILYLGGTPAIAEALETLRGAPVLTVTDSIESPAMKGIINFVTENNRVRFEIDARAAAEDGLSISSKLLSLAVSVRPRQ
jgi:YfiR/HmsC-like